MFAPFESEGASDISFLLYIYIGESPGRKTKNTPRIQTRHFYCLFVASIPMGFHQLIFTNLPTRNGPPCEAALAVGIHVAVSVYLCFKYSPSSWLFGGRGRVGWLSCLTRRIHVCCIYLHAMVEFYGFHVGKYTILKTLVNYQPNCSLGKLWKFRFDASPACDKNNDVCMSL